MTCCVCNTEIHRGERYKSERYVNKYFCCENCYLSYLAQKATKQTKQPPTSAKKPSDYKKLTDYIADIFPTKPNWAFITSQIKDICKNYDLTYTDIRGIIKYAVEYEGVELDGRYGLYQVIPKYIEPTQQFTQSILTNREMADTMEEDEVMVVKVGSRKRYCKKENLEF